MGLWYGKHFLTRSQCLSLTEEKVSVFLAPTVQARVTYVEDKMDIDVGAWKTLNLTFKETTVLRNQWRAPANYEMPNLFFLVPLTQLPWPM